MAGILLLAFMALLMVGLLLLRSSERQRQRTGLPRGQVIYADTGAWDHVERPLFSHRHRLAGRPDYLLKDNHEIIPVEVKSGRGPLQPYRSHVLQLAAYCLLVEETYQVRPTHGVIHYDDKTFAIDYTPELEHWLLSTLDEICQDAEEDDVPRSHENSGQCMACGYRLFCDQSLV